MPKLVLTRMPMPRGVPQRWRKKYKGKIYYFRGAYQECLRQWEAKKVELDRARIPPETAETVQRYHQWQEYLSGVQADTDASTIGGAVTEWLQQREAAVVMGQIRQSTVSSIRQTISCFQRWAGGKAQLKGLNEKMLADFFKHLAAEISAGRMKKGYAHQVLLYTKAFIKRQWELHRIDLPRNIHSRDLSIRVPTNVVKVLTTDEITAFYKRATSLLQTCILLSLNCGFNQIDIATLTHNEVDWGKGTITKRRVKTGGQYNVPTVTWKLWDTTLEQLKKHRSKHPELVLLGRKDRELIQGGGLERVDVIGKMWRYVRNRLGNKREYKLLRKTAASKLAEHPAYGRFAQYFLSHAPSSVADRHYVQPQQDQFDEAIKWLGLQFSFCFSPAPSPSNSS